MAGAAPLAPSRPPLVTVLGPTASGKSTLALALAEQLGGEILCCDSMQVYRGMDIGTAKPSAAERSAVPHHMLDLVSPGEHFNAAAWAAGARQAIAEVTARGQLPIIVGGTGLYFRALMRGLFEAPPADPEIRARHQAEAAEHGVAALQERLRAVDPEAAAKILPGDLVRTSRALEVFEQTGTTISALRRQSPPASIPWCVFSVLLDFEMTLLRPRIGARVDAMMAAGFLDEVRALRAAGHGGARAMQGLGYQQLGQHLDGTLGLDEAVASTKLATAAYARRQRTWFRREEAHLRSQQPLLPTAVAHLLQGYFWAQGVPLRSWEGERILGA